MKMTQDELIEDLLAWIGRHDENPEVTPEMIFAALDGASILYRVIISGHTFEGEKEHNEH